MVNNNFKETSKAESAWLSGKAPACGAELSTAWVRIVLPALCCLHEGCPVGCYNYTLVQCTPLLVKQAVVVPGVTRDCGMQGSKCAGERSTLHGLKTHGPEVQNGRYKWPRKMYLGPRKSRKKRETNNGSPCISLLIFIKASLPNCEFAISQEQDGLRSGQH